ncbi:DUF885 family protein [Qipengyuania sp. XHP0207]|uniref:DUF885 domain-containing protein n=1 Tax=Qipengyuania sp. XHP0207 TaxID=3038078 RepID=UPI00241C9BBA|nr:DUF885 family protein [Qipengyuania sp. XHP0207]MDG5749361.1 DUF885 family protein [Qipengyuania sp. XHP0207]
MKAATASFLPILLAAALPAVAQDGRSATPVRTEQSSTLQALADEYYRFGLAEYEREAKPDGSTAPTGKLPSVTPSAYAERERVLQDLLARARLLETEQLGERERIDAAVLVTLIEQDLGDIAYREWEMPLNSDSNFWSYLVPSGPMDVVQYENYIARMRDLPRFFDENIANMRSGLDRGFSVPAVTLEGRDVSIEAYAAAEVDENPFWRPFAEMPARIPAAEQERLRGEARNAIEQAVAPAYRELLGFMRDEYLPKTRKTLGAREFPRGEDYYAQQIRQYTTLDLTAEQIHRIGLDEVARITAAMEKVKEEAGFDGSLSEFIAFLRTDAQFVAETPDELMGVAAYAAKRVDDKLGEYFGFLPRYRHGIRPVDPAIAPFYTAGRGGLEYCQINTYDLPSRPVYNIPALTLHECAPGHSFQAAIALEQEEAPLFRRQTYFSGFGEGWGLYVEHLGNEMGIYRTPYERFGQLSYEMWRAARLVIDTGIHHYGWSREQAVDYLSQRTALSEREVGTEIDRYISWPGQALAYKLGELTIKRVRTKAENELGDAFDLRKFHDVVLSLGSVPLPVLEQRIDRFIAEGGAGLDGVTYD